MSRYAREARRPAAFLDRDGTLVRDVGYARTPEQIELLPGVREGLARLRAAGFVLVVATNQSGIGRGFLDEAAYALQVERLGALLGDASKPDAHYFCPHHPTEALGRYRVECDCRKPKPGMFLRAIAELGLDPERSIAIGDAARDAEAARAAGVATVVRLGEPDAEDFARAVETALAAARSRRWLDAGPSL